MTHSGRDFCRHRDIMNNTREGWDDQPWNPRIKDASIDFLPVGARIAKSQLIIAHFFLSFSSQ